MKKVFVFLLLALAPVGAVLGAEKVDINTASLQELDQLAGIGPVYAQRIIDGRPYVSLDDLDRAKGIGPATLQKIKEQGMACVNCETPQETQKQEDVPLPEAPPSQPETSDVVATPPAQITYPSGVVINELLPSPQGADESEEWIEIYNPNNFEVDLSGWKIQDLAGNDFSLQAKILGLGYLVLFRPQTKITLNDTDQITLLQPDGKTADSVLYPKASTGQSYNRQPGGSWAFSQALTPGSQNAIYIKQATSRTGELKPADASAALLPKEEKPAISNNIETQNPWFLFFTALGIAILSASALIFIKYKIKKTLPCQDTVMPKP